MSCPPLSRSSRSLACTRMTCDTHWTGQWHLPNRERGAWRRRIPLLAHSESNRQADRDGENSHPVAYQRVGQRSGEEAGTHDSRVSEAAVPSTWPRRRLLSVLRVAHSLFGLCKTSNGKLCSRQCRLSPEAPACRGVHPCRHRHLGRVPAVCSVVRAATRTAAQKTFLRPQCRARNRFRLVRRHR